MALIQKITLESGMTIDQAYIRVQGVNGNKDLASISLEIYVSQPLCEEGKVPAGYRSYNFTPNDSEDALRWDKQAYEHLKTLPEFSEAIDA